MFGCERGAVSSELLPSTPAPPMHRMPQGTPGSAGRLASLHTSSKVPHDGLANSNDNVIGLVGNRSVEGEGEQKVSRSERIHNQRALGPAIAEIAPVGLRYSFGSTV